MITLATSCKKEKHESALIIKNGQGQTTLKLLNFKQKIQIKIGDMMEADSALWYLEGLLNYEQANNTHEFQQIDFYYDTLPWPASNGTISTHNIQQIYASLSEQSQLIAYQNGDPAYTFNLIDLNLLETDSKTSTQALAVTLSGGLPEAISSYLAFSEDDYWISGGLLGKCDIYAGQCVGRDATTELEYFFNLPKTNPGFYVSIESVDAHAFDYPASDNPYGNYKIWAENINHSNNCLDPDELNYYLSKWEFIRSINKPADKTFCAVDVQWNIVVGKLSNEGFHTYSISYGEYVGSNNN
ncbi:MAG: hypothetical protein K0B15_10715 [Lentimicrobium sp.]|nr:hypothetical protein [Lentimicrobium sp.]